MTTFVDQKGAKLVFADTQAGLTTPDQDPTCQVTNVELAASPQSTTTDATLCGDGVDRVDSLTWVLNVTFYRDDTDPDGFSWWQLDPANLLQWKWFRYTPLDAGEHEGECQVVPGPIGGPAGPPLTSTSPFPVQGDTLTHTPPAALPLAAAEAGEVDES